MLVADNAPKLTVVATTNVIVRDAMADEGENRGHSSKDRISQIQRCDRQSCLGQSEVACQAREQESLLLYKYIFNLKIELTYVHKL